MKTFQQKKTPSLNALTYIDIPFKIHTIWQMDKRWVQYSALYVLYGIKLII